jgi:predicted metal-dependent peptidase
MKATEHVSAARRNLVLDHPFFGVLSLKLELVEDPSVPSFRTDGRQLRFNPEFALGLNRYEAQGVVAHGVLHCANGHTWRRGSRDPKVWNRACDYAVNPIVLDAGMVLPADALDGSPYRGMSAEEIYERLLEQSPQNEQSQDDGTHAESEDDPQSGGAEGSGCGEVVDCEADQMPEIQAEWSEAVLNAAKRAESMGVLPAGLERLVEDIKNPPQDWRAILRRFVQRNACHDYSWRQPSSRYVYAGLYLPALRSETMPPMVIAVDTSGSIDDLTVKQFAKEIGAIVEEMQPERVYVIYCDAEIQGVDVFERGEPVVVSPKGFGGTDFRPVFEWIAEEDITPSCLVYLTDMAGAFPEAAPEYPVLWGDTLGLIPAPWGDTIQIRRG